MRAKDVLGRHGEAVAAEYVADRGLRVIDRNWRCPGGEIDLVALEGAILVVIEVKTRSSLDYGHPFEAIGDGKLARLYGLGAQWARAHGLRFTALRVDAVSVLDDGVHSPVIEHLRAVG